MSNPSDAEIDARYFSERLVVIHNQTAPLTTDDRDLLMLVAGFVRGQASRIRTLEAQDAKEYSERPDTNTRLPP